MKILMLTQWFTPEPTFKGLAFAKELQRLGHEVEVLTGFPNYPGGKIYSGYRVKLWQREAMDGVRVIRVALYPSHDGSGVRRVLNYLSFSLTSLFLGPFMVRKPEVVYVYNLITLAWSAVFLRWLYGCKIVYDIQDLWPESVASSGMMKNRYLLKMSHLLSLWAYRQADQIVVLSPGFKKNLQERGVPAEKIVVIYNWAQEDTPQLKLINDDFVFPLELEHTFKVVFAGTMGIMQGLDTVLDAALISLKNTPNVRFVLIGDGIAKDGLMKQAEDLGLTNIIFVPRRPMNEMGRFFTWADALLVHLKKDELFRITIPSKTQAYLAAGRPIVMAVTGDAAELIKDAQAGVCCEPEEPQAMAACIRKLSLLPLKDLDNMGINGKNYYDQNLSLRSGVKKFEEVFKIVSIKSR